MVGNSLISVLPWKGFERIVRQHIFIGFGVTLMLLEGAILAAISGVSHQLGVQTGVITWLLAFPLSVVTLGYSLTLHFLARQVKSAWSVDGILKEKGIQQLEYTSKLFHIMQTPLATIQGYAELLAEPPLQHNDEFLEKCHHVMVKEVRQINQVLDRATTLANLEACGPEMRLSTLRLLPLVEEVIQIARQESGRDILLENRAGDAEVKGDMVWLEEAFTELISNALKFSSEPLPVEVTLTIGNDRRQVEFWVRDYGNGLSEYEKSILFQPFVRIINEKTREYTGSGLGLYIVQQIVQRHYGDVRVESQPLTGSTFKIILPLAKPYKGRSKIP